MSFLQPNLVLRGSWRKVTYTVLRLIRNDCPDFCLDNGIRTSYGYSHVLTFLLKCDSNNQQHVVLKEARDSRSFNAEVNALDGYLRGHNSFRQLVNFIPD